MRCKKWVESSCDPPLWSCFLICKMGLTFIHPLSKYPNVTWAPETAKCPWESQDLVPEAEFLRKWWQTLEMVEKILYWRKSHKWALGPELLTQKSRWDVAHWGLEPKLCPEFFTYILNMAEKALLVCTCAAHQPCLAPHSALPPSLSSNLTVLLSSSNVPDSFAYLNLYTCLLFPLLGNLFPYSMPDKLLRL